MVTVGPQNFGHFSKPGRGRHGPLSQLLPRCAFVPRSVVIFIALVIFTALFVSQNLFPSKYSRFFRSYNELLDAGASQNGVV